MNLAYTPDSDTLLARDGGRILRWSLKELRDGKESAVERTNVASSKEDGRHSESRRGRGKTTGRRD